MIMCSIVCLPLLSFQIYPVNASNSINYLGVEVGDWIKYELDNNGSISIIIYKIVETEGIMVTFNATSGNDYVITEKKIASLSPDIRIGDHTEFVIPANSKPTDTIYGFISDGLIISKIENRVYSGSERSVLYTNHRTYYDTNNNGLIEMRWDKETGILVEASFFTQLPDKNTTSSIKLMKTNMWKTQIFGLDSTIFYVLIIAIVVLIAFAVVFLIRRQ